MHSNVMVFTCIFVMVQKKTMCLGKQNENGLLALPNTLLKLTEKLQHEFERVLKVNEENVLDSSVRIRRQASLFTKDFERGDSEDASRQSNCPISQERLDQAWNQMDSCVNETGKERISCENRCGAPLPEGIHVNIYCGCDSSCLLYQDCCADFEEYCPEISENNTKLSNERLSSCISKPIDNAANLAYFKSISFCPSPFADKEVEKLCEDSVPETLTWIHLTTPVRDLTTDVTYKNYFCAICNGVNTINVEPWTVELLPRERSFNYTSVPNIAHKEEEQYIFSYTRPYTSKLRPCKLFKGNNPISLDHTETCSLEASDCAQLRQLCHNVQGFLKASDSVYFRNPFCSLCTTPPLLDYTSCIDSEELVTIVINKDNIRNQGASNYAFSILFKFQENNVVTFDFQSKFDNRDNSPKSVSRIVCSGSHSDLKNCVLAKCEKNYMLIDGHCVPKALSVQAKVTLHFSGMRPPAHKYPLYASRITSLFVPTSKSNYNFDIEELEIFQENSTTIYPYIINVFFPFHLTMCDVQNLTNELETIENDLPNNLNTNKLRVPTAQIFTNLQERCKYKTCNVEQIDNVTDYAVLSDRTLLLSNGKKFKPIGYILDNNTLHLCVNYTVVSDGGDESDLDDLLASRIRIGYVTIACLSMSSICLVVRIVLQWLNISVYRTLPGQMQFCLTLTLFTAGLLFLLRPQVRHIKDLCLIFGGVTHWAYLSVFFWASAISFDFCKRFNKPRAKDQVTRGSEKKLLACYVVYSWLSPSLIVLCSVVVDLVDVPVQFQPMYTYNGLCWISQNYPLLIFFVAPMGILLATTIICYSITFYNVRVAMQRSNKIRSESTRMKQNKREALMYVRLLVLSGITWIAGFVASAVDLEVVWYIFTVLNAGQGVFLFFAFVCNRRVWYALKYRNVAQVQESSSRDSDTGKGYRSTESFSKICRSTESISGRMSDLKTISHTP